MVRISKFSTDIQHSSFNSGALSGAGESCLYDINLDIFVNIIILSERTPFLIQEYFFWLINPLCQYNYYRDR